MMRDPWPFINELQGALGGFSIRAGHVTAAGGVDLGADVTAAKVATGDYRLTFDPPFSDTARVIAMQGQGAGAPLCTMKQHVSEGATASTFRLRSVDGSGSAADTDFWFVAIG